MTTCACPRSASGDAARARRARHRGPRDPPPARFTEASLVKRLEELGVGRPSTYASIMQTIQDRGYVWKKGSALVPSFTAFAVIGLLEEHFPALVDYGFTASMEDDLDEIANGDRRGDAVARALLLRRDAPTGARRTAADSPSTATV